MRPSDGLVIEASILGRVLRLRLLRIDATIVVVPTGALPVRSAASGDRRGLAEAVRTIEEGAAILAETRRTAS